MAKYCLDTNVILHLTWNYKEWSDNFLKQQSIAKYLENIDIKDLSITDITKKEIQYAQYNYEIRWKKINYSNLTIHQKEMLTLFRKRNKIIEKLKTYSFDVKAMHKYKKTRFQNKEWQKDHCDFLIASICLANNLILITDDEKCFNYIDWLKIENWTK